MVERAPDSINALLPANLRQGFATGCQWSDTHARLRSSRHIAEAELLAPVTFALEAGPALRGAHVVFVMDNSADVAIINRRKTNSSSLFKGNCEGVFCQVTDQSFYQMEMWQIWLQSEHHASGFAVRDRAH